MNPVCRHTVVSLLVLAHTLTACAAPPGASAPTQTPTNVDVLLGPTWTLTPHPTEAASSKPRSASPTLASDLRPAATNTHIPPTEPAPIDPITATPGAPPPPGAGLRRFEDPACQIAFSYPADWTVFEIETQDPSPRDCATYGLRPSDWRRIADESEADLGEYALYLTVSDLSLEAAASWHMFVQAMGSWWVEGRQGSLGPADLIQKGRILMLRGIAPVGVYSKTYAYMGLRDWHRAVIHLPPSRTAVVEGGLADVEETLEIILATFEFFP